MPNQKDGFIPPNLHPKSRLTPEAQESPICLDPSGARSTLCTAIQDAPRPPSDALRPPWPLTPPSTADGTTDGVPPCGTPKFTLWGFTAHVSQARAEQAPPRRGRAADSPPQRSSLSRRSFPPASTPTAEGPQDPIDGNPNVGWSFVDSISACPAGDSVITTATFPLHHPSKLRVLVFY